MEYRMLGHSGVKVAPIGLGTDNIVNPTPEAESIEMIYRALDGGINLIDTSNSYAEGEAERVIGKALKANGRRHEVILATKAYYPTGPGPNDRGGSRLHLMRACEGSLHRLQTDYIDLYQLHRPDFDVPIDETLGALTDLVRQGKVRYIGSSTAPAWRALEGVLVSEMKGYARFVTEQSPYNLLDRRVENELVPMCQKHGLGILAWSPLAHGMLAGRYTEADRFPEGSRAGKRGGIYAERISEAGIEVGNRFVSLAKEAGLEPAQLAVLWVKDQPAVTAPLIGPRTLAQLEGMLPVLELTLDDSIRAACDELVPPGSAVANFFNSAPWQKMRLL